LIKNKMGVTMKDLHSKVVYGILGIVLLVGSVAHADGYMSYQAIFQINRFQKESSGNEWLFDKRADQLRFGGAFIFENKYATTDLNAPVRIITFQKCRSPLFPAAIQGHSPGDPDAGRRQSACRSPDLEGIRLDLDRVTA
jgi:hypothetical protein